MKKQLLSIACLALGTSALAGNFDDGSAGIPKDSSIIKSWANGIEIYRGYLDINDPSTMDNDTNRASYGTPSNALYSATGNSADVVSLGDGGWATLTFEKPIINGPGPDFAIFENGFEFNGAHYGELAFVEVSTDGEVYIRFPATSLTQTNTQLGGFDPFDRTDINNLAGKHAAGYGTPFDLEELKDSTGIDINNIRFVRVIDVIGDINLPSPSLDMQGNIINDPYSTPFWSGGFDLEAVAVINELQTPNRTVQFMDVALGNDGLFYGDASDGDADFKSGLMTFEYSNSGYWSGFAASNLQNDTTPGFTNDKSAITAAGVDSLGDTYGIFNGSGSHKMVFTNGGAHHVNGMYLTNTTYAYLSMLNGDMFGKKFGGATGNDEDFFLLKIWGTNLSNEATADTVKFYLADFRYNNSYEDYIVNNWRWVDLERLGPVTALNFELSSSDVGDYGMNTPAYFAFDQISILKDYSPEISTDVQDYTTNLGQVDTVIDLSNWYTDADNPDAAITYTLQGVGNNGLLDGQISNRSLTVTYEPGISGTTFLAFEIQSNGQTIKDTINITVKDPLSSIALENSIALYPNPATDYIFIDGLQNNETINIYNANGQVVHSQNSLLNLTRIDVNGLQSGVYVIVGESFKKNILIQ